RRLRMTELAMAAKITRSRLSHAVARLEKNGWVRREDCPSDKRGQFAVLTDEGFEVLARHAPGHVEAVRQAVFDRLTPEQQKSLGEVMKISAEGLQRSGAGADLPWLRCPLRAAPLGRCVRAAPPGRCLRAAPFGARATGLRR